MGWLLYLPRRKLFKLQIAIFQTEPLVGKVQNLNFETLSVIKLMLQQPKITCSESITSINFLISWTSELNENPSS